jgi:hypothetical protein
MGVWSEAIAGSARRKNVIPPPEKKTNRTSRGPKEHRVRNYRFWIGGIIAFPPPKNAIVSGKLLHLFLKGNNFPHIASCLSLICRKLEPVEEISYHSWEVFTTRCANEHLLSQETPTDRTP